MPLKKILTVLLLFIFFNQSVIATNIPVNVSIFNVKQERVVKVLALNSQFEQSIIDILNSSPDLYGGFSINPDSGLILHIPFPSPIEVMNSIYSDKIKEIYLFLEPGKKPKALVFFVSKKPSIIVVLNYDTIQFINENNLIELWI